MAQRESYAYVIDYLGPGPEQPFKQAHEVLDVSVVVFDAVWTPAVDVPERAVNHDDVGVGPVVPLKQVSLWVIHLRKPQTRCNQFVFVHLCHVCILLLTG